MEKDLHQALVNKEQVELFLNNLENLLRDGTVNEYSYHTLKSEYSAQMQHAMTVIEQIKRELTKRLDTRSHELNIYQQELANLEARYKVGQLSGANYMKLTSTPQRKAAQAEADIAHLTSMMNAQSSQQVPAPQSKGLSSFLNVILGPPKRPVQPAGMIVPGSVPAKPPVIAQVFTSVMLLPDRVLPGSTVGIIANVTNSGQQAIHHKAEFKINGKTQSVNEIMLEPGQCQEVTFMAMAGNPGDYYFSVNDATAILKVISAP